MNTIATLQKKDIGYISEEALEYIPLKFLEMGCLPGAKIKLIQISPLNDLLYICINDSYLAIRRETASKIKVLIS